MPEVSQTIKREAVRRWYYDQYRTFCNGFEQNSMNILVNSQNRVFFQKDRSWTRTPNYRSLKQQKKYLPDNNFGYIEDRVRDDFMRMKRDVIVGTCTGNPWTIQLERVEEFIPTSVWGTDKGARILTEAALRAKLIEKAKGAEWSVPTFVGEGRQTINLVLGTASTLASAMRNLRRGNWAGALANLGIQGNDAQRRRYYRDFGVDPRQAAANGWLTLIYGVKPLLSDVYNSAETLAKVCETEQARELRVTASTRRRDSVTTPGFSMGTSPPLTATKQLTTEESCRGVWRCKPTVWNIPGSFGLLNPALVAWELTRLSFVVDWFLPIGRYLEGLDVPMRFEHLGGTIGYRRKVEALYTNWTYYGNAAPDAEHDTSYLTIQRSKLTSHPTVGLDSIVFEPKMGAARIASALSLLQTTFTGLPPGRSYRL